MGSASVAVYVNGQRVASTQWFEGYDGDEIVLSVESTNWNIGRALVAESKADHA